MDIEVSSIVVVLAANVLIILGIIIYSCCFFKWDQKNHDDLAENWDCAKVGPANELYLGEGASNIESLLGKDDTTVQYGTNLTKGVSSKEGLMAMDITSILSRGLSRRNSIMTLERSRSFLPFHRYGNS